MRSQIERRDFLKLAGLGGAVLASGLGPWGRAMAAAATPTAPTMGRQANHSPSTSPSERPAFLGAGAAAGAGADARPIWAKRRWRSASGAAWYDASFTDARSPRASSTCWRSAGSAS